MSDIESLEDVQAALADVRGEIEKRIVGQDAVIDQLLACVLCDGNALLESNPGLGKTLLVRTLADVTDLEFSRIQNTPDLMPSDITGTEIIRENEAGQEFRFQEGPVFANVVLADEINRATPKTQSALLEAMQEGQVTAAGETRELPEPFFLLATQNPIDQEGSLHPEESLYLDGRLWRARDALEHAREAGTLVHDGERTRLYDIDATTLTLGDDGRLREADCMVYETEYEGDIYTVETKTGRRIRVSGNHPFLVNRAGAVQWIEATDLDEGDHLVAPRDLELPERPLVGHDEALAALAEEYPVVRGEDVSDLIERLEDPATLEADEIDTLRIAAGLSKQALAERVGASYDRVCGFLAGANNGLGETLADAIRATEITVGDHVEAYRIHRIEDALSASEAGFLVGFVLAEGSVSGATISVTQKNLPELLDRWIAIAERIGLEVTVRERPTGREARISSKPFVEYLEERFHLSGPEKVLSAPAEFRESFLETFLLTESHFDTGNRRVTFVQTDRTLTNVVAHLLLDYGIIPWIYEGEGRYELRIQGEDLRQYLETFEWRGEEPDVAAFDSAHRTTPLSGDELERLVDVLGMKHDGALSAREWYTAYRWLRTERDRMATAYFESFLEDAEATLEERRVLDIEELAREELGAAARSCGLALTDVVEGNGLTKHRVWQAYESGDSPETAVEYVAETHAGRMAEAEELTEHLRGLVEGDVFYDPVRSIEREPYDGTVIGLSVPERHNYLGGLGACGISHNTYPLPEAQSDRFLMKILVDFPSADEERAIVDRYTGRVEDRIPVEPVLSRGDLRRIQELTRQVPMADDLIDEAIGVVGRTREDEDVEFGASPRASMGLVVAAKARALIDGRAHVSRADIEAMAPPVLRHRIVVDFRAEREGRTADDVIDGLL